MCYEWIHFSTQLTTFRDLRKVQLHRIFQQIENTLFNVQFSVHLHPPRLAFIVIESANNMTCSLHNLADEVATQVCCTFELSLQTLRSIELLI